MAASDAKIENQKSETIGTGTSYDETPYDSYPFAQSHPDRLYCVGKLFGLTPPPIDKCRVLELGCAGGGNILPLAVKFPQSEYVGIDLSERQIADANRHKEGLGLKNCSFSATNIMDIDESWGAFDYIMCHGVYSWVPDFVREKILEICRNRMSPDGLAFISYNAMPGWGPLRTMREMMLLHIRNIESTEEKAAQARALIKVLSKYTPQDAYSRNALSYMEEKVLPKQDYYFVHEFLEEENNPFYLTEFNDHIEKHQLKYVGDSSIETMFAGNMPGETKDFIKKISDLVKQEQYMDFIRNRQFRQSVICHGNKPLNRSFAPDNVRDLYFRPIVKPVSTEGPLDASTEYKNLNGKTVFKADNPLINGMMRYMHSENGRPMSLEQICNGALNVGVNEEREKFLAFLKKNSVIFLLKGMLMPHAQEIQYAVKPPKKPRASRLARYQCGLGNMSRITNLEDYVVIFDDPLQRRIMSLCDGESTKDKIVKKLKAEVKNGRLESDLSRETLGDDQALTNIVASYYDQSVDFFLKAKFLQ